MQITADAILKLLIKADIEGLIAAGAPHNEYEDEAQQLSKALTYLNTSQQTEEHLLALVTLIWAESFNLTPADMSLRMESIRQLSKEIQRS